MRFVLRKITILLLLIGWFKLQGQSISIIANPQDGQAIMAACVTTSTASPTANVCSGTGTTTLTNSQASGGLASFQWKVSIDGGAYNDIAGATTNPYTTAAGFMTSGHTYTFKCNVTVTFSCTVGLSGATATITPVAAPTTTSAAGADQTGVCSTATFAGNSPGAGETGAWSLVSGSGTITTASSATSGVTGLGSGDNVFKWTITLTSNGCTSSDNVTINSVDGSTVTSYANYACPTSSTTATLSILPPSFTFTSIQWQQSDNGGAYTNIAGATTTPYYVSGLTSGHTYTFKPVITTTCGTYSPIASSSVTPYGMYDYTGGNVSYATANTASHCYNNLTAGQKYCFSFVYSHDIEIDWQTSGGCSDCGDAWIKLSGGSSGSNVSVSGGGGCIVTANTSSPAGCAQTTFSAGCSCIPVMYDNSCGTVLSNGFQFGSGCTTAMTVGNVYYICLTVPAGCGGMSICPQINCLAGNCSSSPLPIELLYFNAVRDNGQVQLQWATATETNNDYFTIEHSSNGKDFSIVGKTEGAGNSTSVLHYSTTDENPLQGICYYRLKQTDYDGKFAFSNIVSVDIERALSGLKLIYVYPEQNKNRLQYQFNYSGNKSLTIEVLDVTGKQILSDKISADYNGETLNLIAPNLNKGVYLFKISDGVYSEIKRFLY